MKKIFFIICAFFAFSAGYAQTVREDEANENQDRLQQEPPREPQREVERAAAPNPTKQNTQAQQQAEQLRKKEVERSTGKETKNPAKEIKPVPDARLSEPDSKPLRRN